MQVKFQYAVNLHYYVLAWTLMLLLTMASCKKETVLQPRCYECEMTYANGIFAGQQFPCTTDIDSWQKAQVDNTGSPIRSVCKEK